MSEKGLKIGENFKIKTFEGSWSELQEKVRICRHRLTKYVEQIKGVKQSCTESEIF